MSKLLLKTFFLLISVLIINLFVRATVPYFWDVHSLQSRLLKLKKNPDQYNVLFLGSSKTMRSVNPVDFDQVVGTNSKKKVRSLNFGRGGSSAGELYSRLQQILAIPNLKTDYIFYELRDLGFTKRNLHTNRSRYWLNWDSFWFIINVSLGKNSRHFPISQKIGYLQGYTLSYIENLFNMGMMPSMVKYFVKQQPTNLKSNGYVKRTGHNTSRQFNEKIIRRQVQNRAKTSNNIFSDKSILKSYINKGYVKELLKLIEQCKKKHIQLIVLIPPLIDPSRLKEYKAIYHSLPKNNKLQINIANKYPELYTYENCYDRGHLNHKGAKLYSAILAKEYLSFRRKKWLQNSKKKIKEN